MRVHKLGSDENPVTQQQVADKLDEVADEAKEPCKYNPNVTKGDLTYMENALNDYLKRKYPNATHGGKCARTRRESMERVNWGGKSGINNIDQAIGYFKCIIDKTFPERHVDLVPEVCIYDDYIDQRFPTRKCVYWLVFPPEIYKLDAKSTHEEVVNKINSMIEFYESEPLGQQTSDEEECD